MTNDTIISLINAISAEVIAALVASVWSVGLTVYSLRRDREQREHSMSKFTAAFTVLVAELGKKDRQNGAAGARPEPGE